MPFIKHKSLSQRCLSPEHDPPSMIVLEAGEHTWKCPSCGKITTFTVHGVTM